MRTLPILFALAAAGWIVPAVAQHAHHADPAPVQPHADHVPAAAEPHAGHVIPSPAPAADPHAGHVMPSPAPAADPHAGHVMPAPAPAMPADPHAGHAMEAAPAPAPVADPPPPAAAFDGPVHAADTLFDPAAMSAAREQLRANQGGMRTWKVMADRLETHVQDGADGYVWDVQAWYGGDIDKLWLKSEGEGAWGGKTEEAELQALWSRAVTPWFDAQAGLRYDFEPDSGLAHLVLGFEGLAAYYVEVDAAAFLSERGDLTARVEVEYDQHITQKLVLQPRVEVAFAAQDVPRTGTGSGLSSFEAGLRLRYEYVPNFAPYVGVGYERKIGETGRMAREEGENPGSTSLLLGVSFWF